MFIGLKWVPRPSRYSVTVRYLGAIALVAVALGIRLGIASANAGLPFITFFPTTTLAAVFLGFGPGLLAALSSSVLVWVFLLPPTGNEALSFWGQVIFLSDCLMICWAVGAMHHFQRISEASLSQIQAEKETLEHEISERKQAEEQIADNLAVGTMLAHVLRLSLTDTSLEHILEQALTELLTIPWLHLENQGCIFLKDESSDVLHMVTQHNIDPEISTDCANINIDHCLCGKAATEKKVIYTKTDHGHYCVPIIQNDTVLGVFTTYLGIGHSYSENEVQILELFADTLAGIITRKKTEHSLRNSKELARTLLNASADGALLMNRDGIILAVNQALALRFDHSPKEMIGKSLFDMIPEQLKASRRIACDKPFITGEPFFFKDERNGMILDNRIFPVKSVDDHVTNIAVFSRDITAQQLSEKKIKDLLSYQQAILGNCPVGIAILSSDRIILEANTAFARIYGRAGEDLIGKSAQILYGNQTQFTDIGKRAYPLVQTGGSFSDDVLMVRSDGSEIWVSLYAHMVDMNNPALGVVWAAEDISARKALEMNLQSSNEELERFAYVASHDLRQPLRMVSSYLTLIERKIGSDIDQEMKTFLGFAIGGAKRMDRMIVDLLEYSRISRFATERSMVSLSSVMDFALKNLQMSITEANAQLVVPDQLPVIPGYETELERLFQNLIGNAVKFRAPDRPIKIIISCEERAKEWILSISDTGIGISPKDYNRLFGVFQRLVTRDQYEGNGIGLATCRKIIEHHQGRIWLDSKLDEGCTFWIALPKGDLN